MWTCWALSSALDAALDAAQDQTMGTALLYLFQRHTMDCVPMCSTMFHWCFTFPQICHTLIYFAHMFHHVSCRCEFLESQRCPAPCGPFPQHSADSAGLGMAMLNMLQVTVLPLVGNGSSEWPIWGAWHHLVNSFLLRPNLFRTLRIHRFLNFDLSCHQDGMRASSAEAMDV